MATLAENAAAVKSAAQAIDAAIVAKGGTTAGGLTNAAAAIEALPSGGDISMPPGGWIEDGNTHLWLYLPEDTSADLPFMINIINNSRSFPAYSAVIDWGDGSPLVSITSGKIFKSHEYTSPGVVVITISSSDMTALWSDNNRSIFGGSNNRGQPPVAYVEVGDSVTMLGNNSFSGNMMLMAVKGNNLSSLVSAFYNSGIRYFTAPRIANIGSYSFYNSVNLLAYVAPGTLSSIGNKAFQYCYNLRYLDLSQSSVREILSETFIVSEGLLIYVDLPGTIEIIAANAFANTKIRTLVCRASKPPDLQGLFSIAPGRIIVPHGCAAAYKAATNWVTYAASITEMTEAGEIQ